MSSGWFDAFSSLCSLQWSNIGILGGPCPPEKPLPVL